MAGLPGLTAFPVTPPSLGQSSRERPINYVIVTSDSYANLAKVVRQFQDKLAQHPGFVQVDTDLRLNKPEVRLEVNRERAADMGVSVDAIARTVETMLGGRSVTRYKREGEQYDVVLQTQADQRSTPDAIERLFVRGRNDTMIPLAALVNFREVVVPRDLNHFGQRRSALPSAPTWPRTSPWAMRWRSWTLPRAKCCPPAIPPTSTARAVNSASRRARWRWCSGWRCCSSTWCWPHSSRASSTRW